MTADSIGLSDPSIGVARTTAEGSDAADDRASACERGQE
jgi:hypothetical protein